MQNLGSAGTGKREVKAVDKLENALGKTPSGVESHVETVAFVELI